MAGDPALPGYAEADLVIVAPSGTATLQSVAVRCGNPVTQGRLLLALDTDAEARVLPRFASAGLMGVPALLR